MALDVARILVTDPDELAKTDIADHALAKLRESNISEVVLLGRRGVAQAAYTNSEFLALGDVDGVDVVIDPDELVLDPASEAAQSDDTLDSTIATKVRLAREFAERPQTPGNKRIVFRFLTSPVEIAGDGEVATLTCVRNAYADATGTVAVTPTEERFDLETGLEIERQQFAALFATEDRATGMQSFIDNGPGIPDAIRDTLFYPMITGKEGGTGLGLSIAQNLIDQHKGRIDCISWPGHTEFTIYLPLRK